VHKNKVVADNSKKLLPRADNQITFIDQPMVELVRGVSAIGLTTLSYLFINLGALGLTVQLHLHRALHLFAKFPALIINITSDRHLLPQSSSIMIVERTVLGPKRVFSP
jgi:hypothetical protein